MSIRLGNLTVNNFRSLNGVVSIPLDAPIVLVHGSNGMGKTSVLSALELALTGRIDHLERVDPHYASHLLHQGTSKGSINVTHAGNTDAIPFGGTIQINANGKTGRTLLSADDARFFSERCYLPQSALGRLLELYQDSDTKDKDSRLTKFVKELLGLDQLDAIVDGLYPAFNVSRIRNLVPDFRRWEANRDSLDESLRDLRTTEADLQKALDDAREKITKSVTSLYGVDSELNNLVAKPNELAKVVDSDARSDKDIIRLTRARQELLGLSQRWQRLPQSANADVREQAERKATKARADYDKWQANAGARLEAVLKRLRPMFPSLPTTKGLEPSIVFEAAETAALAEQDRCDSLLKMSKASVAQIAATNKDIARSKSRLASIDIELGKLAENTDELAALLAGITTHIHDDNCPVCNRNFSETGRRSLSTHVAATIAKLTQQGGRLKAYTQEKAQESRNVRQGEQRLTELRKGALSAKQLADAAQRKALIDECVVSLSSINSAMPQGSALAKSLSDSTDSLSLFSRSESQRAEILKDFQEWIFALDGKPIDRFDSVTAAIATHLSDVTKTISELQQRQAQQRILASELMLHSERIKQKSDATKRRILAEKNKSTLVSAAKTFDTIRSEAKQISNCAANARASIVGRVFNTSLNSMWRDLFVRLAPNEQFVPHFKVPENARIVEASLETVHRRDQAIGGPPGTMLSAGNLNTAALTLFLALHLSVKNRLPWLILDDPVQSMDDVHISQFAALLRSISKRLNRQVILAVHERALFDYLALEMSPAFEGDRLLTIELSRTTDGKSVAKPELLTFRPEKAIAA